ncbi:MAG: serine hydrolase domain-containing protein [Thermoleophilaceae bacterium]
MRPAIRPHRAAIAIVVALIALAPGCGSDDDDSGARDDADAAFQQALEQVVKAKNGPPGAISVLQRGSETKVLTAGVADTKTRDVPQADAYTRTASTTKAITGGVALWLVGEDKLTLDDTIGKRLPGTGMPRSWADITLAQLMQHRSGIPSYTESKRFGAKLGADPQAKLDSRRLWTYAADEPLSFKPGTKYAYSNTDNIIVALMAEAASGKRFEDLLRERVFEPAGMERSSLPSGFELPKPYLHGYDPGPPREDISTLVSMSGVWASGGVTSTPADMVRFARAYIGAELFPSSVREQQFQWVKGESDPPGPGRNSAGLSVFRYETECGTVYGHTGNIPGYTVLFAATDDGEKALTTFASGALSRVSQPEVMAMLRDAQVKGVCALLAD